MLIIKRSSSRAAALLYIVSYISISITSGSSIQKEEDSVSLRGGRRRLQESPYLLQQQPQQQTSPYLQQQPQLVGAEPQSPYLQQGEESQASPYLQQPQQDGQLIAAEPQLASPYLQQAQQEEVLLAPEPQNELLDEAGWEIGGGQLATGTELQASPVESDVKASWQELEEASWKKNDEEPKLSPEDQNENELEEQAPQMAPTQPPVHELTPEELNQKQMRSYLGGLIPSVDENILPMFLRNTLETKGGYAMDLYGGSGEPVLKNRDLVFYWHVPRTGGLTMKNIMNFCYDLRRPEQLEDEPSMEYTRKNILNMDTMSPEGLQVSYENNIAASGMIDFISSNYFLSGSALFSEGHYGKAFTILRHPAELSTSLFFHRRKYIEAWQKMPFHDYVASDGYMDNWLTRQLTGTMPWVELTERHLEQAKLTMSSKIFVGVLTEMEETLRQLRAHFGWEDQEQKSWPEGFTKEENCESMHLKDMANKNKHPDIPGGHGGRTWKLLIEKDKWDMGLYYYGLELFSAQRNRYPPPDEAYLEEADNVE